MDRNKLKEIKLPVQPDAVEVHEIVMSPGETAGLHLHPCPVVGYIAEGTAIMQVEGREPEILNAGSAFYEPANVPIRQFGNYSNAVPMKFVACYLLHGRQDLIKML